MSDALALDIVKAVVGLVILWYALKIFLYLLGLAAGLTISIPWVLRELFVMRREKKAEAKKEAERQLQADWQEARKRLLEQNAEDGYSTDHAATAQPRLYLVADNSRKEGTNQ